MLPIDELEAVLHEARYWSAPFCRRFLDAFDEQTLEDPWRARRWARVGLELVARVEAAGGEEQPVLRARATTVLGSSCRTCGDAARAEAAYGEALRLYRDLNAPLDRADLRRRIAYLRLEQGRLEDALAELEAARDVFEAAADEERHGLVLMALAEVFQQQGDSERTLLRLIEALPKLEKTGRAKAKQVLMHNIAVALATRPKLDPETLRRAIELVRKGRAKRGERYGHRTCTLPDAKARWVLGLLYWRIPKRRPRAVALLESARDDLVALGALLDVALISLTLGEMYAHKERWGELEVIAAEALRLLRRGPVTASAVAAYRQWQRAVLAQQAEQLARAAEACRSSLSGSNRAQPPPAP